MNVTAVLKRVSLGVLCGAAFSICGCEMNVQSLTTALGLLGSASTSGLGSAAAPAASPLAGPLTASLPQGTAPAAPASTPGGAQTAGAGTVAARIVKAGNELPDPFPYAPGTQNGNLGCADVVTTALENAGMMDRSEHQLSVAGTMTLLRGKGWEEISPGSYADGDVIVWDYLPGGSNMHIGIIEMINGEPYAINNSSSQRRVIKVPLSSMNRKVKTTFRYPGATTTA